MLKIRIVTVGKDKDRWITEGVEHYCKLLSRWANVEIKLIPDTKSTSSLSPDLIMKKQAEQLEKAIGKGTLVALSDRGEKCDSRAFAGLLEKLQVTGSGSSSITFLIGGAYGLDSSLLKRAHHVVSMSGLTFSHQLCRLIILEQLYRGLSIIHGTSYHK